MECHARKRSPWKKSDDCLDDCSASGCVRLPWSQVCVAQAVFPDAVVNQEGHDLARRLCLEFLPTVAPGLINELGNHGRGNEIGVVMTSSDRMTPISVPLTQCRQLLEHNEFPRVRVR